MLGEKGKFKISVNIKNNESKTVLINGEERTLYLPLLTAAEFTLGNDNFTNVEVNSGKIINDGNNSLVTFVTIPGLKESLDLGDLLNDILGNSSIDLSDSFEITGETDNFEIPAIIRARPRGLSRIPPAFHVSPRILKKGRPAIANDALLENPL